MIASFKDREAQATFERCSPGNGFPPNLVRAARRKLVMLHRARTLDDLRSPPSNHLEALKGDSAGEYSIRINDQWRVCFVWADGDARNGEIVDHH